MEEEATMRKYVSFFGSIGVGKTTAGKAICELCPEMEFVDEDLSDNPYIEKAYEDMKKWGFLSSLEMLRMMSCQFERFTSSGKIGILDNGIRELICYARLQRSLGIMSESEFFTYERLNHRFLELTPNIDLYVFFTCSEEVQIERIRSRGRAFELELDPTFLRSLNLEYEKYVISLPKEKLLVVNTDRFADYPSLVREIKTKLDIN